MENTINIGIDLGTTNSVIAKFVEGKVEIFRNPSSWKESLPSVVAFKKNKIIVGEKAKEYLEKDPYNVAGAFKRKMGTSESYLIKSLNVKKTPIELSAQVIKELKTFVPSEKSINSAVITIPASFDTIQSNATKEAGLMAGFQQVVLLQEPIAASLAYANKYDDKDMNNGYWLVYDLGGGTFDVALVKIQDEEMRIIDHEGDNFLGGKDFDADIIEKLIIPYLKYQYSFDSNLEQEFKSAKGKYNKNWYILMNKAEDAKIELSRRESSEIEIELTDNNDTEIDESIEISRAKFESIIKPYIDRTINMIENILKRNELSVSDIEFTLLIGGSTYIPFVKKQIEDNLKIPVKNDIDPTTAVAIGAAHYASTKTKTINNKQENKQENKSEIVINMAYEKASKDTEVFFAAKIEGKIEGLTYKIIRNDGGYDSGLKKLKPKIAEELPLVENTYNFFTFKVYNNKGDEINTNTDVIGISQGKYSIVGQPLPEDICLELDDDDNKETKLHMLFKKNSILSIKKNEQRLINKTIKKGSQNEFIINVMEGSSNAIPEANKTIGYMTIKGLQLKRDLIKGADIELSFEISESRDLTIIAYIPMLDQEFKEIFTPTQRHLPIDKLIKEISNLQDDLTKEINSAINIEDYETAEKLNKIKLKLDDLKSRSKELSHDDITDKRYQLEDKKRKLALNIYNATKDKKINKVTYKYFDEKLKCKLVVDKEGNEQDKQLFKNLVKNEKDLMNFADIKKIKRVTDELVDLKYEIWWRSPDYLILVFEWIKVRKHEFIDKNQGEIFLNSGEKAIKNENFRSLKQINYNLLSLLPRKIQEQAIKRETGLI